MEQLSTITPLYTGRLSLRGVGRVGHYESAVSRQRCRARKYWAIFEWDDADITLEGGTVRKRGDVERTDLPTFKTKLGATKYLRDYAALHKLEIIDWDPETPSSYVTVYLPTKKAAQ